LHGQTLRDLKSEFASIQNGGVVTSADKEMWEYLANLCKNSNNGIKGRAFDGYESARQNENSGPFDETKENRRTYMDTILVGGKGTKFERT
jgi:hypothetical protein